MVKSRKFLVATCYFGLMAFVTFSAQGSKVLNYEEQGESASTLPAGCNNPFREPARFIEFYYSAITNMAAERGARAKGLDDLFAVYHLREMTNENAGFRGGEESSIDRLIVTQICHYEKISTQKSFGSGAKSQSVLASDPGLHDHLAVISKKLLADSVSLYRMENEKIKKNQSQEDFLNSKRQEIYKAKTIGEEKARRLIR